MNDKVLIRDGADGPLYIVLGTHVQRVTGELCIWVENFGTGRIRIVTEMQLMTQKWTAYRSGDDAVPETPHVRTTATVDRQYLIDETMNRVAIIGEPYEASGFSNTGAEYPVTYVRVRSENGLENSFPLNAITRDEYFLSFNGEKWEVKNQLGNVIASNVNAYVAAVSWSTLNGNEYSTLDTHFMARLCSDLMEYRKSLLPVQTTEYYAVTKMIDEYQDVRARKLGC